MKSEKVHILLDDAAAGINTLGDPEATITQGDIEDAMRSIIRAVRILNEEEP